MTIAQTRSPITVWDRVVCAIDGAPLSVQAAQVAARLMPTPGRLTLCTVISPDPADSVTNHIRTREAGDALARAQAEVEPFHDAELQLREGSPVGRLSDELLAQRATLVTVGSQATGGAGLGRVASAMLHELRARYWSRTPTMRMTERWWSALTVRAERAARSLSATNSATASR